MFYCMNHKFRKVTEPGYTPYLKCKCGMVELIPGAKCEPKQYEVTNPSSDAGSHISERDIVTCFLKAFIVVGFVWFVKWNITNG